MNMNDFKDENTRLKTRLRQVLEQLRGRDRLLDEVYKSAYITASGNEARHNLNKDALMLVRLKREVEQLKDQVLERDDEIASIKMSVKMTKIQELEAELKVYVGECARMRKVAEAAVKGSGEVDVARVTRQA